MVFPSYYLPSVSWFSAVLRSKNIDFSGQNEVYIELEACENFHKQTCRNRCYIDSPNGKIALSVPIDKSNFSDKAKCLMRDIRISRQFDWQRQHWTALESSYYNSPFFEFLQDDFRPVYDKSWTFLMDLNEALMEKCFALLNVTATFRRTDNFAGAPVIPPASTAPYYQVFAKKHGFIEDLSIVDLLFNMGKEAALYL
ncbi:MAG: WbqC family protein [Prevotella sp.]|nr:WbqC family protein [Prevotella sp.]